MRLELNEEQALLRGALEQLLKRWMTPPLHDRAYVLYSEALQQELADGGFLSVAAEGLGPLEAALVVEAVARAPFAVEVAASALVGPALGRELAGPLALCEGVGRPTRFLAQARHAVIEDGGRLLVADLAPGQARPVEAVIAYPLGVLDALPAGAEPLDDAAAARVRQLWRIGLAAEAAGLMRAALDLTVTHVKDRRQFGHPLGDFQALQHRLAVDEQIVQAGYLLAMRAADTMRPADAETAALYVQEQMRKVIYDCHQFTGAMGVTLEYPLHLFTYRLKVIQGELGGRAAQAEALAQSVFG
jgi:alkylation response protein AidB-like acyl-CoA dehydrogenase